MRTLYQVQLREDQGWACPGDPNAWTFPSMTEAELRIHELMALFKNERDYYRIEPVKEPTEESEND